MAHLPKINAITSHRTSGMGVGTRVWANFLAIILISIASLAVNMVASGANAQTARRPAQTQNTAAPWFERFTFSNGSAADADAAFVPRANLRTDLRVSPTSRWGVSFGVQQDNSQRGISAGGRRDTSAGAYYQISPQVRVSGRVNVPTDAETAAWRRRGNGRQQPEVQIESAFRF